MFILPTNMKLVSDDSSRTTAVRLGQNEYIRHANTNGILYWALRRENGHLSIVDPIYATSLENIFQEQVEHYLTNTETADELLQFPEPE